MSRLSLRGDRDVALGLVTVLLCLGFVVAVLSGAVSSFLDRAPTREVAAVFADAQQVREGTEVRVDGIDAGKVSRVELMPGGRTSKVTMDVREDVGSLYADAGAVLRFKTVLGGSFYVDIGRGTPGSGPLASPIPVRRTDRQVELDDITPVLRGDAKRGLKTLPRELQDALSDRQAPAATLEALADVSADVERGVGALRGEELDRDLRRLVRNAAATTQALDRPAAELKGLVSGAAVTLRTVAGRRAQLQESFQRSPAVSAEMVTTLRRLERTLDLADPLLADLERPADDVAPTLAKLRPVVEDADRLLDRARPLLTALRPAASSLAGVAQRGLPLVEELGPSLDRTDEVLIPMLAEKDPGTTKSTAVMIGGAMAGVAAGAGGQMDANGHFLRFPATAGNASVSSLPCQLYLNNPDKAELVACRELSDALATYLNYNPLERPAGTGDGR